MGQLHCVVAKSVYSSFHSFERARANKSVAEIPKIIDTKPYNVPLCDRDVPSYFFLIHCDWGAGSLVANIL